MHFVRTTLDSSLLVVTNYMTIYIQLDDRFHHWLDVKQPSITSQLTTYYVVVVRLPCQCKLAMSLYYLLSYPVTQLVIVSSQMLVLLMSFGY